MKWIKEENAIITILIAFTIGCAITLWLVWGFGHHYTTTIEVTKYVSDDGFSPPIIHREDKIEVSHRKGVWGR